MLCSCQEANATSQPRHTVARELEGRPVWLRELVGVKHRAHQANVVVGSAEQRVTYFVRQHSSQRASKIVVVHHPAD
jgi:hypothetical protein